MAIAAKTKYPTLKLLIAERGYSQKLIAEHMGMHPRTFCMKLQGKQPFTLDEGLHIQSIYFPDVSMNELFSTSKKN